MRLAPTALPGVRLLEPAVHRDGRGFLVETLRLDRLAEAGLALTVVQENQSRSARGTVRGLHFQASPGQTKLVRVARGRILDVAVDIRAGSPTFRQHVTVELDDVDHRALLIPAGFAHGFAVLSDEADVVYVLDRPYDPGRERGIAWDDPDIGVAWPFDAPVLSERDRGNPRLAELDPASLSFGPGVG